MFLNLLWESFMIRWMMFILWAGLIFLFTCSESLEEFILKGEISFQWNSQPKMSEFLYPLPAVPNEAFISRKLGHAMSFFILTIFGYCRFSIRNLVSLCFLYAILTEVLQLFFQRGGRLFDIGFDSMGILLAFVFLKGLSQSTEKGLTRRSQT
jgi:VanZ family protein